MAGLQKRLRPTIALADWTLAVHLEATRKIQNQKSVPAYGCDCKWCALWRRSFDSVLPQELKEQLRRVGVDLEHPTDVYEYDVCADGSSIRVLYHAVGKILNGVNVWVDTELGKTLHYSTLRASPFLSLVVVPQKQVHTSAPVLEDMSAGDLLCIDLRLNIPHAVQAAT